MPKLVARCITLSLDGFSAAKDQALDAPFGKDGLRLMRWAHVTRYFATMIGKEGGVEGLAVVDLFCGSGALGVEALSRGAASSTFVDLNPDALAAVRQNLAAVGLEDEPASLVRAALPGWLESAAAGPFDLALCDPPYDFEEWPALLGALRADAVVM